MEPGPVSNWTKKYKQESSWNGDLCEIPQHHSMGETYKGNQRLLQELHLPNQNIGGFRSRRDLPKEFGFRVLRSQCIRGYVHIYVCTIHSLYHNIRRILYRIRRYVHIYVCTIHSLYHNIRRILYRIRGYVHIYVCTIHSLYHNIRRILYRICMHVHM